MSAGLLKIDKRRRMILEILNREGKVNVNMLADKFQTTPVTIRNDLNALEQDGYLQRVSGGAVPASKNTRQFGRLNVQMKNITVKQRIAEIASRIIRDGDTLFINSGTTTFCASMELKKHKNLSIVTNSLDVATELGSVPTFRVILLGGEINAEYAFTYGNNITEQMDKYRADYALLSIDGLCIETGISTYHPEESYIDMMMMERAGKTIIVADSSKLGKEGFSYVADLNRTNIIVTDNGADPEFIRDAENLGIEVITG